MEEWIDDLIIYKNSVEVGDIIRSPLFANLLFRDIEHMLHVNGFWVNPRLVSHSNTHEIFTALESGGLIKKTGSVRKSRSYKFSIPENTLFVVVYKEPDCDCKLEYTDANDRGGHYPELIKAQALSPAREYDPKGIVISFRMNTEQATHAVNTVELNGQFYVSYLNVSG